MSIRRAGRVVILGAGQAGLQAAASLVERGAGGQITLVGDEPHAPYQRPPLSKGFLKGELDRERLLLKPATYYAERGIMLALGRPVASLDVRERRLETTDGGEIPFDTLVIASGTRPRIPPLPGAGLRNVRTLRGISDVEAMRPALGAAARVAIVGGGYIGLEVAAVLARAGKTVTVIEAADRVLKRVTSAPVSRYFTALHRANGVEVLTGTGVEGFAGTRAVEAVVLADGRQIATDIVLLSVGALANSEIAAAAGIAVADGILVDALGRTSADSIYACGDCARFPSRRYDRSVRIESVQNAIDQAKSVAATIAGEPAPYDPVPWFWSDQYETKLQIAGLFDPGDEVRVEGEPGAGPFVVEYRRDGRLVAADAIDNARAHMLSRRRIAEETAGRPAGATPPLAAAS